MSQHWIEPYDPKRHRDHMWGPGCEVEKTRDPKLDPQQVYLVRSCSFTFEFHSVTQLNTCLTYFSLKVRPSSRIAWKELGDYGGDHWEVQRWFDRLPQELLKETKRIRIVKALQAAVAEFTKS